VSGCGRAKANFPGAKHEETPMGRYWLIPEGALFGFKMSKPGPKPRPAGQKGRKEAIEVQNQGRLNLVDHMGG